MTRYDSHCHVFNGSILKDSTHLIAKAEARTSWWSWWVQLLQSIFGSETNHNKFILKSIKNQFPNDTPATCPLAMDISYLFAPTLRQGEMSGVEKNPLYLNPGLKNQLNDLKALSLRGNCYPFFPVDARRSGVVNAILAGDIVTRKPGGFYGIKMYHRLGYHPISSNLSDMYAYCAAQGIPITTHASPSGFPPYDTISWEFSNPDNYKTILAENPSLRINFAHWGHGNKKWANSILELMRLYPNVYADLACYTKVEDLREFFNMYWKSLNLFRERTLYGSDYDIFYLTDTKFDMNSYIKTFISIFGLEDMDRMMCRNPEAFLGIGEKQ